MLEAILDQDIELSTKSKILQFYYRSMSRKMWRLDSVSRSPIYASFTETLDGLSTIWSFKLRVVLRGGQIEIDIIAGNSKESIFFEQHRTHGTQQKSMEKMATSSFKLRLCLLWFVSLGNHKVSSFYYRIDYQSPQFEIGVPPNGA